MDRGDQLKDEWVKILDSAPPYHPSEREFMQDYEILEGGRRIAMGMGGGVYLSLEPDKIIALAKERGFPRNYRKSYLTVMRAADNIVVEELNRKETKAEQIDRQMQESKKEANMKMAAKMERYKREIARKAEQQGE